VCALTNRAKLSVLSCLQLTRDWLWVNWGNDTNTKSWIFDNDKGGGDEDGGGGGLRGDLLIDPLEFLRVSCVCQVNFGSRFHTASSMSRR
jgi:hypothetical protein